MAVVTETFRKEAVMGDLKQIIIQTSSAAASGDTIDFGSDAADGKGAVFTEILNSLVQDDVGADKTSTWDPATGILTLGTITTGIHNIVVWGY